MNFAKKLFTISLLPLAFSCSALITSCNKNIVINCKFLNEWFEEAWNNPGFDVDGDEFKKSFEYGDIVELKFTTKDGREFTEELPFVSDFNDVGYYSPCLIDYTATDGTKRIGFVVSLWYSSNEVDVKEQLFNQPAKITMKSKKGFLDTLNLARCSKKLTFEECGSAPDEYANFRDITDVGNIGKYIKKDIIYRGSAPYKQKDSETRHEYVNMLMEEHNIDFDICLAQKEESFKEKVNSLPKTASGEDFYIKKKLDSNKYIARGFRNDYFTTPEARENVKKILEEIAENNNKTFYIHCDEGKDRTGFIIMLLEALARGKDDDAITIDDIIADFMLSYKNYFNITLAENITRFQEIEKLTIYRHLYAIMLDDPINEVGKVHWFNPDFDLREQVNNKLKKSTISNYAKKYVKNTIGLTDEQIKTLIDKISLKQEE